ncbi:uncharacterized protein MCYG_00554 [Microsporum canis CBS 113480]|uniref:Ig-like domain-containing protein n=1 Tax=Arthroderma otae (strain ATCC MYA-4605 / CBS 113480) TaxID=554155 RepID=C5FCY2_ARTOC|nr:uncharacterized protein MCYG_00554 [Microsporum canis CBS 113480]EEQ27666.1 predicted protein [Microsporum canis CBS 113480]
MRPARLESTSASPVYYTFIYLPVSIDPIVDIPIIGEERGWHCVSPLFISVEILDVSRSKAGRYECSDKNEVVNRHNDQATDTVFTNSYWRFMTLIIESGILSVILLQEG